MLSADASSAVAPPEPPLRQSPVQRHPVRSPRGGRFSKWEMDEKFDSSEEMVEDPDDHGLSR
jgi:hypothetical protein